VRLQADVFEMRKYSFLAIDFSALWSDWSSLWEPFWSVHLCGSLYSIRDPFRIFGVLILLFLCVSMFGIRTDSGLDFVHAEEGMRPAHGLGREVER